ncbi:uncharacterized protein LOC115879578 [Sitophilus oryzae]|uniref:Uncharacterized protein LOC115879578 n=1 Tax=Sitophilus oryzae TaxID=7048 RepID=A0A6J2XLY1_SITOR|nr:uncharacterized protein LOC115879578 [Sitophilus oryzae]
MVGKEVKVSTRCSRFLVPIKKLNDSTTRIKRTLKEQIPDDIFKEYDKRQNLKYKKIFNSVKQQNIRKFDNLNSKELHMNFFNDNSKWFKNLSNIDIPKEIADFLSLGPRFGIPCQKNDIKLDTFLADIENVIEAIPDESKDTLRARVTNITTNFLQGSNNNKPTTINVLYKQTKSFLSKNPELYIVQSDKGGCTVAIHKADYIEKTQELLKDSQTYIELKKDPTSSIQTAYNNLIKKIRNAKEFTDAEAKNLTIYNSVTPKLYCLPKIHKEDIPFRPIVASIKSTTYNISRQLADILKLAFENSNNYSVKDTFAFVDDIQTKRVPDGYVLISLDVISLFTNIPMELALEIVDDKWEQIKKVSKISKENFTKLLHFIFDNTYFIFNNKFYKQIYGTPMGSPISPVLANMVLDYTFDKVLTKLPFKFPFLYRYVDDIIAAVPKDSIELTVNIFNSFNEKIQFTVECEKENSVPFLDTRLIRQDDGEIILDWYQKPTASGRYLNFFSNHPTSQKYNTIRAIKNRVSYISHKS